MRPSGSARSSPPSRSCRPTKAVLAGGPRAAPRMTSACEAPRRSAPRGRGARRIGHEGARQSRARLRGTLGPRAVPLACARRRRSGPRRNGARWRTERKRRRRPPPVHRRRHHRRRRRRRRRRSSSSSSSSRRLARGLTSRAPSRLRWRRRWARCCVRCFWSSCATCATARDITPSARRGGAAGGTRAGPVLCCGLCLWLRPLLPSAAPLGCPGGSASLLAHSRAPPYRPAA